MAFVVVTHQPAAHVSLLPELLGRHASMVVQEVKAGTKVELGHVYLSQPGMHLALIHTVLQPMKDDASHASLQFPIDYFFRTLAADQKDRAICVVLSGTGTDGTLGLQAVKGAGGMCMAQSAQSPRFPGMPGSALATGLVDYVLPVEQLPAALLSFVQGPYVQEAAVPTGKGSLSADHLRQIYVLLRQHTKHDFSAYKTSTLRRRIERRMNVQQMQTAEHYITFLREHLYERDLLFQELLIGVTSFFRDPEAFEVLATRALPELLAACSEAQTIRVWVPGCSTGEEAYSLAILLREMIIFAQQDLLTDPPFTKLDLLSCRNLLIYLDADVQKQLLPLFHYVLNPGGLLFLGSSETIGGFSELFSTVDTRWRVFQRKDSLASQSLVEFPVSPA